MQYTDVVYTIDELKEKLTPIFSQFPVKHAMVFGSYARDEAEPGCDIDLVIQTTEIFDLQRYYEFEQSMRHALQAKVDVTFEDYINPYMKEDILKEAVLLYEK